MAKILVIDDEADLLEMMRLVLEQRGGHQTVLSAEGTDGLAKALADPPDLAIIDVMMPGITGYDICRQLRANPATASVPVLILTARAQPMDRDAAMEAGANDYMTKPVMMAELLERVGLLLSETPEQSSSFVGMFTLMSLRGGVGATTVAVNLATMLARAGGGSVCLVDLCSSSGHVALQLGLRPDPNWSSFLDAGDANFPDAETIAAHLLQHSSGLRVLASPFVPVVGQGLSQKAVQAMFQVLRQKFPIIVVDAPAVLDEMTMEVIEATSAVGLVLTAEPPSIQTAIGTLRALQQWSPKLHVILNQIVLGPQPPAEAIARTLKRTSVVAVPFDPAQARALAHATPLVLGNPDSPLAQAIQGVAQMLVRAARE
ncbi:MAG: response regulator [Chloroflexi bacterium]|nr:response regulator [Chloroflexota bacterium]